MALYWNRKKLNQKKKKKSENKGLCKVIKPSEDTSKAQITIYADLEYKRLMDVKVILKIHLQQK